MLTSRRRPPRRRLLVTLVASVLVLAACGNSKDDKGDATATTAGDATGQASSGTGKFAPISGVPGVTDKFISFAALGTKNSPLGGCQLDCYAAGVKAYFEFRNSKGGVNGRTLDLSAIVDDQLMNHQVKALEIVQGKKAFGVFTAPTVASGFPALAKAGIPVYTLVQQAPESAGYDSIFPIGGAVCISCTKPFYAHAAQLLGAKNVAALGYGISAASKECVAASAASVKRYGPAVGASVAYTNDSLAFGLPNGIAPEVTAMKEKNVDLILTCTDGNAAKTLEQEMERQGMKNAHVLLPFGSGDPTLLAGNGALFEGNLGFSNYRPYIADAKGTAMADFLEWIENAGVTPMNLDYAIGGWVDADLAYQGILAAGPNFDQAKVIAATNKIEDYTAGGLISPIDWTRQHKAPTEADPLTNGGDPICISFIKVQNGKWTMVSDAAKPFDCWDPRKLSSYTEPTPTNFT